LVPGFSTVRGESAESLIPLSWIIKEEYDDFQLAEPLKGMRA
jgi:hypothetical protein